MQSMSTPFSAHKNIPGIRQGHLGRALLLAALLSITAIAQSMGTPTSGTTPSGLSPGAPAGSFALSGFEVVNLYNGNLNFSLPLLQVGARGSNQTAVTLTINPTKWQTESFNIGAQICLKTVCQPDRYIFIPTPSWWSGRRPGYGPGVLQGRRMGETELCSVDSRLPAILNVKKMLSRLTFTNSNGTEFELRDSQTGGQPLALTNVNGNGQSRGNVFISADGSAMTFVSDATIYDVRAVSGFGHCSGIAGFGNLFFPSGLLYFADGTVYRIDNGLVSWSRDRNGNKVRYSYDNFSRVVRIIDQLNREVKITYGDPYGQQSAVSYDEILYKGFGGAQRRIRVWRSLLSQTLRGDLSRVTYQELFPTLNAPSGHYDTDVVSAVELPDGRRYKFYYNNYGELARVELPTGGAFEYDYGPGSGAIASSGVIGRGGVVALGVYRRVAERRVYRDGATLEGKSLFNDFRNPAVSIDVVVDHQAPNGGLLAQEKHYFFGDPAFSLLPEPGPNQPFYSNWKEGREHQTEEFDASGNALRRTIHTWEQRAPVSWWTSTADSAPPNDPRIVETTIALLDTNQVSKNQFTYDQYNNQTAALEYDFGSGEAGPLLRQTQTVYLTSQNGFNYAGDTNIHIRRLPAVQTVRDAVSNIVSQTTYEYDNYTADANHAALLDRPAIIGMDTNFTAGYQPRGNATAVSRWLNTTNSWVTVYSQYDVAGNLVKVKDPRGAVTTIDYDDSFGPPNDNARSNAGAPELGGGIAYAFPTKVTNALGHTTYTKYDFHLGKPVNLEDANEIVSSVTYDDDLDRPTQSVQARYKVGVGAPVERRQTTITYDDANRVIITESDLATFNDNKLISKSYHDGLGRMFRSAAREGDTWTITDTQYGAFDRVSQVSNPYRAADPDSASPPSGIWTRNVYDTLGRVVNVETPDGAHVTTLYSGNLMTVVDQAGKKNQRETDALGRLIKITEAPGELNYVTYYSYDELDNLVRVTQGPQARTFVYNSLSKLISATNPESGTITYAYDKNGNITEKADARGVKTTMTYDALDRLTSKVYEGTTPEGTAAANATPRADYFYDKYSGMQSGAPNWSGTPSKGRLVGVTYKGGSEGTYSKYDAFGRIVTNHQRQGIANYVTTYTYNRADAVTREDRGSPARRRNQMIYDEAGRLASMKTGVYSGFDFPMGDLVSDISYTPFRALQSERYGNGLIHSMSYNNRQQPIEVRLGRTDNLESIFRINYIFGTTNDVNSQDTDIALAQNNGNIARVKYFISGTLQYAQTFKYDPADRLSYAVEHSNGVYNDASRAWYQTFDYDPFGNRGMNVEKTSDNMDSTNSALKLSEFSGVNNRITRDGFAYDYSGNLTKEPGKEHFYDAENRLYKSTVVGGVTSQYFYDGNCRRVMKVVGGVATRFEYGKNGELITEWNDADTIRVALRDYFYKGGELLATTKTGATDKYEYATADHLGSPRAWTGPDGAPIAGGIHDYAPFGEELFAGYGVRTTDQGYASSAQQDGKRKQFSSKERDAEMNLDYFLARYYSSIQGRFLSHDPGNAGAKPEDPQSWNGYSYALNNPLAYTDPNGTCPSCPAEVYVELANAAYSTERGGRVGVWQAIEVIEDGFGYRGVLFKGVHNGNTEYIYATAGTDDANDVLDDFSQLMGISGQYSLTVKVASYLADRYEGVSFTGHSLGGGLAAAGALAVEGKAVTFNAAGLSPLTKSNLGLKCTSADITAYIVNGELVDRAQPFKADGNRIYMGSAVSKTQALGAHKMDRVIRSFKEYQYMNSAQYRHDQQLKHQAEILNRGLHIHNVFRPR
jgi:RHS repeat-associated protein